jgi:ABC-type multidrug transport system permease subunit
VLRTLLLKDFLRRLRAPSSTLITLAFPLAVLVLMALAFTPRASEPSLPSIEVAVAMEDRGFLARLLSGALSQDMGPGPLTLRPVEDRQQGIRAVRRNRVSALLVVPEGFTDSLLTGGETYLEVLKNPSQSVLPEVVEEGAGVLAVGLSGLARIFGGPLGEIQALSRSEEFPADEAVMAISKEINQTLRAAQDVLFPPLVWVATDTVGTAGKKRSAGSGNPMAAMFPGFLILGLLFMAELGLSDLHGEMQRGTLRRLRTCPAGAWRLVLSKLLGATILCFAGYLLMLATLVLLLGLPAPSVLQAIPLGILVSLSAAAFLSPLVGWTRSERQAGLVASVVILVMSLLGGSLAPVELMPRAMRSLAPFTYNYWALQLLRPLMGVSGGTQVPAPWALAVLSGITIVLGSLGFLLMLRRVRRHV